MDYNVDIDNKNKVVLCTVRGILDWATAQSMSRDVRKRAFELGYGLLYDVTNLSPGIETFDAYFFPRDTENYEDIKHRKVKTAVVYKTDKDSWKFLETTARNVGMNVVMFCEIEDALKWLSEEQPN